MAWDEPRYDAGYREALLHTIEHINSRIREERECHEVWHNQEEHTAYIQAYEDVKNYLIWVLKKEKN